MSLTRRSITYLFRRKREEGKKEREGERRALRLRTKLKIQNIPMLDALLEKKPDTVVATWYLTAATQLLGRDALCLYALSTDHNQKHPTIEDKLVVHDLFIGYVTK